jgi:hypothetical protein
MARQEWEKLRLIYLRLGIEERTVFESFDGEHEINGRGSVEFLRRWLIR